jgi:predicted RND superfamily exporter protein
LFSKEPETVSLPDNNVADRLQSLEYKTSNSMDSLLVLLEVEKESRRKLEQDVQTLRHELEDLKVKVLSNELAKTLQKEVYGLSIVVAGLLSELEREDTLKWHRVAEQLRSRFAQVAGKQGGL